MNSGQDGHVGRYTFLAKPEGQQQTRVPVWGNKASKPLTEKTCGDCSNRRNSQPHRRVHWRDPQGPRMYTNPHTWESAPEGPNLLVGSGRSDWKLALSKQHYSLWDSSPTESITRKWLGLPRPGQHLRLHPLLLNRHPGTKKMAQMKEQVKAPEKIQLSEEEIANLSDAQFKH